MAKRWNDFTTLYSSKRSIVFVCLLLILKSEILKITITKKLNKNAKNHALLKHFYVFTSFRRRKNNKQICFKKSKFSTKLNLILRTNSSFIMFLVLLATHNKNNNNNNYLKMKKYKSAEPILKRTNERTLK